MATLEYTDAPETEATAAVEGATMQCPQCGTTISTNADHCPKCSWTRLGKPETAEGKASDAVAVLLSVIPGLGHIYKGHKFAGLVLIIATPMAVLVALLAATGTAGFGLGLLPIYWFGVMFHVYGIQDRIAPGKVDPGEEF
ncbi:MAG: zinc ribbon domain-containing protein [Verrucomicrobiota bacterium]|nr:zinc ribbon domain-containing protein [Verrucomicrobiota bacterium]